MSRDKAESDSPVAVNRLVGRSVLPIPLCRSISRFTSHADTNLGRVCLGPARDSCWRAARNPRAHSCADAETARLRREPRASLAAPGPLYQVLGPGGGGGGNPRRDAWEALPRAQDTMSRKTPIVICVGRDKMSRAVTRCLAPASVTAWAPKCPLAAGLQGWISPSALCGPPPGLGRRAGLDITFSTLPAAVLRPASGGGPVPAPWGLASPSALCGPFSMLGLTSPSACCELRSNPVVASLAALNVLNQPSLSDSAFLVSDWSI